MKWTCCLLLTYCLFSNCFTAGWCCEDGTRLLLTRGGSIVFTVMSSVVMENSWCCLASSEEQKSGEIPSDSDSKRRGCVRTGVRRVGALKFVALWWYLMKTLWHQITSTVWSFSEAALVCGLLIRGCDEGVAAMFCPVEISPDTCWLIWGLLTGVCWCCCMSQSQ